MVAKMYEYKIVLQGAVYFDSSHNMDDEEYLQPVLTSQEQHFHKLDTVLITFIPLIFGVSINFSNKTNK